MCQLLETIKCIDGIPQGLDYHERRMLGSQKDVFGLTFKTDLGHLLKKCDIPQGLVRCRVLYKRTIESIECCPYIPKTIRAIKKVRADGISYPYKFSNREALNNLLRLKGDADDILIIKKGLVTDTSIANICFFTGHEWVTPAHPLLNGTKRQMLIDKGIITIRNIHEKDIQSFHKVMLINAMLEFDQNRAIQADQVI